MRDKHKENNSQLTCVWKHGLHEHDTDFRVHAYASITTNVIHAICSNPLDRCSKFRQLGANLGFPLLVSFLGIERYFWPPKLLWTWVPTPFTWFFSSRTFVCALALIQTSCAIVTALTPSIFHLNASDSWPSMPHAFPFFFIYEVHCKQRKPSLAFCREFCTWE